MLFKEIKTKEDADSLQLDLGKVVKWSHSWQMSFSAKKCSVLTVTQKKKPITTDYTMSGEILAHVDQQTYPRVKLTKGLDWGPHIQKITAKANKTLNKARRNLYSCSQKIKESAYISLVRPTLEYAQTVWDPYQRSHIDQVEKIQRKAVRFVSGNYSRTAQCNIYERSIAVAHTSPKKMRS